MALAWFMQIVYNRHDMFFLIFLLPILCMNARFRRLMELSESVHDPQSWLTIFLWQIKLRDKLRYLGKGEKRLS